MSEEIPEMRKPVAPIAAVAAGLSIGLTAIPAGAGEASGAAAPSAPEADIDVQVPDSRERLEEYWTRDRMRAAKPMPTPRISRMPATPAADDEDAAGE